MKKLILGAGFSVLAALPLTAMAYQQGDMILRVGAATVDPDASSEAVVIPALSVNLQEGADVKSDTQVGITFAYMFKDQWAVQVLAATPFTHTIELPDLNIDAGETKHLPPTVTVQYFFNNPTSKFQPYAGAGINYTTFFEEDISDELNATLSSLAGAPVNADLELEDSIGLALEIGFDYQLNENWSINAAVWHIDINTDATVSTQLPDVEFEVEIDPWVYMLSAAYKF